MSPPLDRALPGRTIDLIRDGVSPKALRDGGDGAVWDALVSTACSAASRGQSEWEWLEQVMDPRHRLGQQAGVKRGGRQVVPPAKVRAVMGDAWERATVWLSERPAPWTAEQVTAEAQDRALAALAVAGDAEHDLGASDRAVLAFAATEAQRRGLTKITLPRREVAKGAKVGERSAANSLERLTKRGLLEQVTQGRSGSDPGKRKAATYRLRSREALAPHLYPVNRVYGTPAQVYGTPPSETSGTPHQIYGAPPLQSISATTSTSDQEGPVMVTLTLTASTGQALADAVSALQRSGVQAAQPEPAGRPALHVVRGDKPLRGDDKPLLGDNAQDLNGVAQ